MNKLLWRNLFAQFHPTGLLYQSAAAEIRSVRFPMLERVRAAREEASPVCRIPGELSGGYPGWNFHKYLLDRNRPQVERSPTRTPPLSAEISGAIEALR